MSTAVQLRRADSLHPTLCLSFPDSFLGTLTAEQCTPAVLVRLPPALFLDPHTFPGNQPSSSSAARVASVRHLNSTHPSLSWYDFTRVELEAGVGYSDPTGKERRRQQQQQRSDWHPSQGTQVKRVSENKFVVASDNDEGQSRYQDVLGDVAQPLAKEHRAVLITLDKRRRTSHEEQDEYDAVDELTGARGEEPTATLDIPLHGRYLSPTLHDLSWDRAWRAFVSPSTGTYERISLDRPELLWMCDKVEYMLDANRFETIDASELLPSPYSHLSLPLDGSHWHFYRHRLSSQHTPFHLSMPAGDASLGPFVQLVTFASFVLAAIWTAYRVHATLSRVHRVELEREKK